MAIDYHRGTRANPTSQERLTLDVQLLCRDRSQEVDGPDRVVVETKSADGRGVADKVLAGMGIRDVSMSKYCVGIAMLHPELPAKRWIRLLRENFSWQRADTRTSLTAPATGVFPQPQPAHWWPSPVLPRSPRRQS